MTGPMFTDDQLEAAARKLREGGWQCSTLPPYYVTASTAAEILLISERTLRTWSTEGRGPTVYDSHRTIRYKLAEVLQARVAD
jgi:hypothetical protein